MKIHFYVTACAFNSSNIASITGELIFEGNNNYFSPNDTITFNFDNQYEFEKWKNEMKDVIIWSRRENSEI